MPYRAGLGATASALAARPGVTVGLLGVSGIATFRKPRPRHGQRGPTTQVKGGVGIEIGDIMWTGPSDTMVRIARCGLSRSICALFGLPVIRFACG